MRGSSISIRIALGAICLSLLGADCLGGPGDESIALNYDPEKCHQEFGDILASGELDAPELSEECRAYFRRLLEGPCHDLIVATCGEFDECAGEPDCVMARLMAEPDDGDSRCLTELSSGTSISCAAPEAVNPCLDLVHHVCGAGIEEDKPCGDHPACLQSIYLFESGGDEGCEQALREATLYPRCE